MYLALVFVPATRTLAAPYVVSAVIGSASFVILPLALETMVDVCLPIGPEVSSNMAWAMSQLAGGVFIVVMDALKAGSLSFSPVNMLNGLIFQAVLAWIVLPLPICSLDVERSFSMRSRLGLSVSGILPAAICFWISVFLAQRSVLVHDGDELDWLSFLRIQANPGRRNLVTLDPTSAIGPL